MERPTEPTVGVTIALDMAQGDAASVKNDVEWQQHVLIGGKDSFREWKLCSCRACARSYPCLEGEKIVKHP